VTVRSGTHDVVRATGTIRAGRPLDAVAKLSDALDRALLMTGLFERFDSTGRVLRVGPLEQAGLMDAG
jgi:hypothetical protein